jgi:hypothetical protein
LKSSNFIQNRALTGGSDPQISPKRASEPSPTDRNSLEKRVLQSIRTAQCTSFEPSKRCRRVLRCAVTFPESRFENVLRDRVRACPSATTAETELNSPGSGRPRTRTSRTFVRPMVDPSTLEAVSMLVPQLGGTFGALPASVRTHARYTSTPEFTLFWCRHHQTLIIVISRPHHGIRLCNADQTAY